MPRFKVERVAPVIVSVEVDADDELDAIWQARDTFAADAYPEANYKAALVPVATQERREVRDVRV